MSAVSRFARIMPGLERCAGHEFRGLIDQSLCPVVVGLERILLLNPGALGLGSQLCEDGATWNTFAKLPTRARLLSTPSALRASDSENFWALLTVSVSGPRTSAAPDLKERLDKLGAEPFTMPSADFDRFLAGETAKAQQVVKAAGIKVD